MSEYQYYEFQAIDRPLDQAAQKTLRSISSRATITATRFTNHYEWGDFKGDPRKFMERWYDLHLYFSNWGTRRLMLRLPEHFLQREALDRFLRGTDWVELWTADDNVIVDIHLEQEEPDGFWEDDESSWMPALVPLRADVMSGDLRLFYLVWLSSVQDGEVADGDVEPLPGMGPMTDALESLAHFLNIDSDLVEAAAEFGADDPATSKDALREAITALSDQEKTALLLRVAEGDLHVAAELKGSVRKATVAPLAGRTAGALRKRAEEIAETRERAEAARLEAEHRRKVKEIEKARRSRLIELRQRGESAWLEIEKEISRKLPAGYDRALNLLADLRVLATEEGTSEDFRRRLASIRDRHERKRTFVERLAEVERD